MNLKKQQFGKENVKLISKKAAKHFFLVNYLEKVTRLMRKKCIFCSYLLIITINN